MKTSSFILLTVAASSNFLDQITADGDCSAKLVSVQTGKSTTCDDEGSSPQHWWPLDSSSCHAWTGEERDGKVHKNSASGMSCIDENTFTFVQYAGNLNCQGNGVRKTIKFNTCEQDYPPVLYSKGINFECCKHPDGDACKTAEPYVTLPGSKIYKDGVLCRGEGGGDTPADSFAAAPTAPAESLTAARTALDNSTSGAGHPILGTKGFVVVATMAFLIIG